MKRITAILLSIMMLFTFAACGGDDEPTTGVEDGVLTVAMECAYAPYN